MADPNQQEEAAANMSAGGAPVPASVESAPPPPEVPELAYWCYQCRREVNVAANGEVVCPTCGSGFLEDMTTADMGGALPGQRALLQGQQTRHLRWGLAGLPPTRLIRILQLLSADNAAAAAAADAMETGPGTGGEASRREAGSTPSEGTPISEASPSEGGAGAQRRERTGLSADRSEAEVGTESSDRPRRRLGERTEGRLRWLTVERAGSRPAAVPGSTEGRSADDNAAAEPMEDVTGPEGRVARIRNSDDEYEEINDAEMEDAENGEASRVDRLSGDNFFVLMQNLIGRNYQLQVIFPAADIVGNPGDYLDSRGFEQWLNQIAENDSARKGAPPAAKDVVDALPTILIDGGESSRHTPVQCAVCKERLEVGSEAKQLPCMHLYHSACIFPWLALRNTCPVCRLELRTDDMDYEERRRWRRDRGDGDGEEGSDRGGGEDGPAHASGGQRSANSGRESGESGGDDGPRGGAGGSSGRSRQESGGRVEEAEAGCTTAMPAAQQCGGGESSPTMPLVVAGSDRTRELGKVDRFLPNRRKRNASRRPEGGHE
ncbi:hypothetical protein CBR_g23965 [Chara braunii]|uniref:RING-type E3 ubiquitin transferase n=1 Tax=Chara braunii TaxID=69332 RepID=A0A388L5E0_CHABU|nr:hypothetical protein CBR_g23965 [Chara braunii]|eukprot:GBG77521.1 hypothetical protein CBR_g23965 [Chara braunii]